MGLSSLIVRAAVLVSCVLFVSGCDDLPDIEQNVCGNKLVEPSVYEACDGFATEPSGGTKPTACAPPGDRYQCQYIDDADHDCPAGYGAGLDGLCRRGTGEISEAITHTPATGAITSVADFDGDGRVDILASNAVSPDAKAVFFQNGGVVRETMSLSLGSALHPPVVTRIGAEGGADLALANQAGLLLFEGGAGPSFQPKPFTPFSSPVPIIPLSLPSAALVDPKDSADLGGQYVAGLLVEQSGDLTLLVGAADGFFEVGRIPGASLSDVLGVMTTDLDPGALFIAASDEVVVALKGNPGRLVVITPNVDVAFRRVVELDNFGPARTLLRGPFKVDQRVGIAVGAEPSFRRYVQLLTLQDDDQLTGEELFIGADEATDNDPILIGSYDLVVAKLPFVVLPRQLALNFFGCDEVTGVCFLRVADNPSIYPWTTAAFNEKASVIAAGSNVNTGLYLFRANEDQPTVASISLSTASPVQRIELGDLDGDTAGDFLVTTRSGTQGCDDDARLLVAWGEQIGFPQEVTPIADIPGLDAISVSTLVASNGVDAAADALVTTGCNDEFRVGYFLGHPSRQLHSPLPLSDDLPPYTGDLEENHGDVTVIVADVGAPGGEARDGIDDLLAFVGYPDSIAIRPLFVDENGVVSEGADLLPVVEIADPAAQLSALATARGTAVNLDDDDDIELVVVLSEATMTTPDTAVYRPHLFIGDWVDGKLSFKEVAAASDGLPWFADENDPVMYTLSSAIAIQLVVSDLNGDGQRDVAVRLAGFDPTLDTLEPTAYLSTFIADGDGYVERPFSAPGGGVVRALATLEGAVTNAAVAIATEDELFFCKPADDELVCLPKPEIDDGGIIGLAVGDFDADGVSDVAIAREDGLSVHRQLTAQDGVSLGE